MGMWITATVMQVFENKVQISYKIEDFLSDSDQDF